MASVASSRGRSPHSPYDMGSTGDTEDSWQYIDFSSGASNQGSIGFLPSPASGSLNGYAIVGQVAPSPTPLSPFYLDAEPPAYPATTFAEQSDVFTSASTSMAATTDPHFISNMQDTVLTPQGFLFTEEQLNDIALMTNFPANISLSSFESAEDHTSLQLDLGIPQPFQSEANVAPWNPANLKQDGLNPFVLDEYVTPSPQSGLSPNLVGSSPRSPHIKKESESKSPSPIRKVKDGKVEKKKPDQAGKFVIVTPNSINAHAGRPNPFECFEASRTTQRGRKGPLANATKENALQVRRLGACFCCHARKVKCDKERPCKNCKKLMVQVPQVVCWQFQDFLTVLFPDFIRGHFRKDEMSQFMKQNIEGFTVDGSELPCSVELFSGTRLSAVLSVKAKFFTAKTDEVLQHYHISVGKNQLDLQSRQSAPIGLDTDNSSQRDELRKKSREYIQAIVNEPNYAEQVTDAFKHTDVPRTVLKIVQKYAKQSESPVVRRALSVYAMHYVMTRHLCLTRQTLASLQHTNMVPQNVPFVTPRVLNRQIKAVLDELMMREMQQVFETFSKTLKPKSRREWAPCLAAFLVLCLFMEAVESAADTFVISQNEIDMRNKKTPRYKRSFALNLCQEVENMPFKQFAYQFHQIYLTHSKDASSKSFNPLLDDTALDLNELDAPTIEMVAGLRELIQGPTWSELDFLTMDPILPNQEDHPFPRDISLNYTGRLVAKFLLSFTDEKYIFDS